MEDLRAASGGEGIQLEVELLVIRGHAGIPNFHPRPRPSWALGSLSPFATAFCNTHALIKSRPSPHPFLCGERESFRYRLVCTIYMYARVRHVRVHALWNGPSCGMLFSTIRPVSYADLR